jgi:hypothetical protein
VAIVHTWRLPSGNRAPHTRRALISVLRRRARRFRIIVGAILRLLEWCRIASRRCGGGRSSRLRLRSGCRPRRRGRSRRRVAATRPRDHRSILVRQGQRPLHAAARQGHTRANDENPTDLFHRYIGLRSRRASQPRSTR